jgi:hypothetical protein
MRSSKGVAIFIDFSLAGKAAQLLLQLGSPVTIFRTRQHEMTEIYDFIGETVRVWLDIEADEAQVEFLIHELRKIKPEAAWVIQLLVGERRFII